MVVLWRCWLEVDGWGWYVVFVVGWGVRGDGDGAGGERMVAMM